MVFADQNLCQCVAMDVFNLFKQRQYQRQLKISTFAVCSSNFQSDWPYVEV